MNRLILLFLFALRTKSILVASENDVTWTILSMSLLCFWVWEHVSCVAVYGKGRGLSDFIKNILICVLKMNESLTGLKRHEGE